MVQQLSHSSNVKPSLRECPEQGWSFSCWNICSQPEYLKGTCVSKTLKRRTPYWWNRQSEIQRQSCMTWSKKELSDKYVSNCNFFGADRSLYMYMTSATTNVLTHPVPLPSRCFYLPAPFVIHFWKPEVPEGRYQIEKYGSLLPSTTNSVAVKMSEGQKNKGFESRRECTVTHKP